MNAPRIRARLSCQHPEFRLDVDLDLPGHGVSVIFGPSGCGKTTLLQCLAGLQPAQGRLEVNGDTWHDDRRSLPVHRRPLAYVFQEASLFPHLCVRRNLLYGYRRTPQQQRRIEFDQAVHWLGLDTLLNRMPDQLSGGQRQRVAIARALLASPRLLLMDEPLSALDQASKYEILPYLERLHGELEIPVIYVTHSPDEMARLADQLVLMDQGRILAQGPLADVLPRLDLPLAEAPDAGVIIPAVIRERDQRWHLCRAEFDGGSLWVRDQAGIEVGATIRLRVLARDVSIALSAHPDQSIQNLLPATVTELVAESHPAMTMVRLALAATPLLARLTSRSAHRLALTPGQAVWVQVKSVAIVE